MQSINALRPLEFEWLKGLPLPFLNQLRSFLERRAGNDLDDESAEIARRNLEVVDAAIASKPVRGVA